MIQRPSVLFRQLKRDPSGLRRGSREAVVAETEMGTISSPVARLWIRISARRLSMGPVQVE